ncbi:ferredoxin family protein [Candidatus Peregrinibacteria bacterium]|nr:ferredoxin family protein [Candidatus Peregrinibacteria bacterium]
MALIIKTEECIDCGACVEPCPNHAIYSGGEEYEFEGKNFAALSDHYYIVPDKCTECVGFHDEPQCITNCPVDCITKDPNRQESEGQLVEKKKKLYGE